VVGARNIEGRKPHHDYSVITLTMRTWPGLASDDAGMVGPCARDGAPKEEA
jgi:hypothetical protein